MCEDAGASMVTLHARTRAQGYKPGCLWDAYGELKQAVSIPVIANGDIYTLEDALHVMNTYHVDGVMMGRGVMGQPWLIGHIDQALKTGEPVPEPGIEERLASAYEHARLLSEYRGEVTGVKEMRRHLTDYVKGFQGASGYRSRLTAVNTLADVRAILDEILDAVNQPLMLAV
jgi:tRNA-dihydrouridine synthase